MQNDNPNTNQDTVLVNGQEIDRRLFDMMGDEVELSKYCPKYIKDIQYRSDGTVQRVTAFGKTIEANIYMVDNLGNKIRRSALTKHDRRQRFGAHNLLVECRHNIYGTANAFIPKIGVIDGGSPGDYKRPPWLNFNKYSHTYNSYQDANRGRRSRGRLFASAASDFVYSLYLQIARREVGSDGHISDERSLEILAQAREHAMDLFGSPHEAYVDREYVFSSGDDLDDNSSIATEIIFDIMGVSEQFRLLMETIPGVEKDIGFLTDELASVKLGERPSTNFAKMMAASFAQLPSKSLLINSTFSDELKNGWTEYENTSNSNDGFSSLSIGTTAGNMSKVVLQLQSNIEKDDGSLQHGIFQEISVDGYDLENMYFVASHTKLLGMLENRIPGLDDAAGMASISIEYLNDSGDPLGATNYVNTADNFLSDSSLVGVPIPLDSSSGYIVYRLPSIPNSGITANLGQEARRAVGNRYEKIKYLRVYALVGDYIGGQYVRHWLLPLILIRPKCHQCEAELELTGLKILSAE